jgi:hypothetical protein
VVSAVRPNECAFPVWAARLKFEAHTHVPSSHVSNHITNVDTSIVDKGVVATNANADSAQQGADIPSVEICPPTINLWRQRKVSNAIRFPFSNLPQRKKKKAGGCSAGNEFLGSFTAVIITRGMKAGVKRSGAHHYGQLCVAFVAP